MSVWQDIRYRFYQSNSNVIRLIYINVAVFIAEALVYLAGWLFRQNWHIFDIGYLPAYLPKLALRPWSPITYQFIHSGIWHILFNMLFLYTFGRLLEDLLGKKHILRLYLAGGLFGALLYVAAYNLFPIFDKTIFIAECTGASASVMAIAIATAIYMPDYEMYVYGIFRIRLKWLVAILVVLDLITMSNGNAGGHIAHLGGALFGWLYVALFLRGNWNFPEFKWLKKSNKRPSRSSKVEINKQFKSKGKPSQEDIDAILDKISRSGYDRLTKEEKETLFKASEK